MATNTSSSIIDTRKELIPATIPGGSGFTIDQSVVTNTTTVDRPLGSVVTDVSYIPYMRGLAIDYVSYKMRPLRQVWHYFDDTPVNKFIQRPNIIETTSRDTALRDIIKGNRETIQIGSSTAKVLLTETNQTDGNTRIYVTEFVNPSSLSIGSSISSLGSSYTSSVKNYQHYSGVVGANSTIQNIIFSQDADGTTEDFYTGNTLTIVCGPNAGESREIIYYDQATKTATVDPAFSNVTSNSIYSIGDVRSPWSSNNTQGTYITERGFLAGVLHIPDPTQNFVKFRTGDRIFRIVDNPRNDSATATTKAEYRFVSNGLNLNKAQIIERTTGVNIDSIISLSIDPTPTPTPTPTVTPTRSITPTPTMTQTVTPTPTASASSTPAVPASPTPTPTRSITPTPGVTGTPTATPTLTPTKTSTPTPSEPARGSFCDFIIYSGFTQRQPSQVSLDSFIVNRSAFSGPNPPLEVYMENFQAFYTNARGETITGYPNVPVAFTSQLTRWGISTGTPYFISEAEAAAYPGSNIRWIIGYVNGQYIWRNITEAQKTAYSIASGGAGVPGSYYAYIPAGTRFPSGTNIQVAAADPRGASLGQRIYRGASGNFIMMADDLYAAPILGSADYANQCSGGYFIDPIAQTFYVDAINNNDGIFLSSVDLFFKNKGTLPVEVQIRPTVNGYPSSNTVIPGAVTVLEPEDIHTSDLPSTSNASTNTRFTFASPVYLNSGYEYSLVVISDDPDYDYYCAELGQTVLGSDRVVSKQPFTGSLFKSQNGTTWTAYQDEDMMFMLNKTRFLKSTGTVYFSENKDSLRAVGTSNNYMDSFEVQSDAIELKSTNLQYYYKAKSNTTGVLDSSYTQFSPENKVNPTQRKVVTSPDIVDRSFDLRIDLSSTNQDVSPIVYHNRQNLIAIENFINNTGLREEQFVITNLGTGYTDNASVTITSNNVGYGANAYAVANVTTGNIVSIIVDNAGTGYVGDVTAVISGGGGSDATLAVTTETGTSGGPAVARYISKTVTLLDGFDAGDLRVFVTAIKPPGANVELYYKVRNALDTQQIENRTWNRMVQKTSQYTYSIDGEQIEYEYRPSLTSNNIVYTNGTTTFKTFNQFTLKIVLTSDGTVASKLPYVYDLRAIALPEDAY